jgi:hypothetical protein
MCNAPALPTDKGHVSGYNNVVAPSCDAGCLTARRTL